MKTIKKIGLEALAVVVILWGLKFTSPNLRIEGYSGLIFGLVSFKSFCLLSIGFALIYYFWDYLQIFLVNLPLPDPKNMKDNIGNIV